MKIRIPRTELAEALAAVKPAANPGATLPILANVAIVANDKSVTFTATDQDITLRAKTSANVEDKGETTVKCSLLHDIVRSFKGEEVYLELIKKTLRITCGQSKFTLATLSNEDMPPVPRVKDAVECGIMENELQRLLSGTGFANGDESRPILNGAHLSVNGNIRSTACDGRRMATDACELSGGATAGDRTPAKKFDLVLPAKAVAALQRLLCRDEEKSKLVNIVVGKNLAQFNFAEYTIVTKLIDGQYPDVTKIVPKIDGAGVTIGRLDLLEACQRVALVGDGCRLEFRKQTLTILSRSESKEVPGEAVETLLIPETKEVTVTVAASYLIEALSAIDCAEIQILAEAERPIIIKAPNRNWMTVIAGMKS